MNRIKPLWQTTRHLVAVARGDIKPDLVLTNARVLCVYTGKIERAREIWITQGRIAQVCASGTALTMFSEPFQPATYDCCNRILAPGLIDPHIHVESARVTVTHYAEAALLNGTTTIIADNHEIANVRGVRGIEWMIKDGKRAPLNVFWTVPSTVPATNATLETSGGTLTATDIAELMDRHPGAIVGLGEKMDYPQVIAGDRRAHAIIAQALERNLPISGHVYGAKNIAAYAASGITDTHEATDQEGALTALEAGMWVLARGGPPHNAWNSLPEILKIITQGGCDSHHVCLCTDDRSPSDLLKYGLDYVVREVVRAGVDRVTAWQMASLNPATRYGLSSEIGGLGLGRQADVVLLDDEFNVQSVWLAGQLLVENRKTTAQLRTRLTNSYQYPKKAWRTVKITQDWTAFPHPPTHDSQANIIEVQPPDIVTHHTTLPVIANTPIAEFVHEHGLAVLAVLERHGKTGGLAHALVKGMGLRGAAIASSVGHDAHNLLVAGDNERDMRKAIEVIARCNGGITVIVNGKVRSLLRLPITGLISAKRIAAVSAKNDALTKAWSQTGCTISDMEFTLLSLSVIPELRLTDRGLVKVSSMKLIPLFEEA